MDPVDYMICIPAHGVIIGAWFGAFPMPLDWERPWQVQSSSFSLVLFFCKIYFLPLFVFCGMFFFEVCTYFEIELSKTHK